MTKILQTNIMLKDKEVTEQMYWDMLEVLPPVRQVTNAFLVGEPTDHGKDMRGTFAPRYQLFFRADGKYYDGGLASTKDFDTFIINN